MDNSEQFAVVDVIVSFCGTQRLGQIRTWMQVPIGVLLHQHGPDRGERGVGHDKDGEETSGMESTRRRVKASLMVRKASSQAGVQSQRAFFLVRSWRGRAMLEKSGMNLQ
jgi:hypothetical protein